MKVDFEKLICRSVFEDGNLRANIFQIPAGQHSPHAEVPIAECENLLYLPSVLEQGQSLCILEGSYAPQEAIYDPWTLDFVKAQRLKMDATASRYGGEFDATDSDERVCILGNVFSRNFAHWTEELLKVVIIESLGLSCKYVYTGLPAFADAFLDLMAIPQHRILKPEGAVCYASAIFTPAISHENIQHYPFAAEALRAAIKAGLGPAAGAGRRRLWLERGQMVRNGGNTLNLEQVRRLLNKYHFEFVDMGALSLRDQLRMATEAEIIAGPHGAQFAHIMFMPRRSHVIECFSPTYVNPSTMEICRVLGHSYNQIVSRSHIVQAYEHGRDLMVDCEHLELVIDYILSAQTLEQ